MTPAIPEGSESVVRKIQKLLSLAQSANEAEATLAMARAQSLLAQPNPAKTTDSRFRSYQEKFGDESWELDALEPALLVDLIKRAVLQFRDDKKWEEALKTEQRGKYTIECILKYFPDVARFLRERRERDDSAVVCQGCGATVNNPRCLCGDKEGPIALL